MLIVLIWLKAGIVTAVLYQPSMVAVKTSILLLYRRVFTEPGFNTRFHISLWGIGIFVLAYSTLQFLLTVFPCSPVKRLWDPAVEGSCIDFEKMILVGPCLNVATDIMILCLPMTQLWHLSISRKQKLQLTGIFLLGGL